MMLKDVTDNAKMNQDYFLVTLMDSTNMNCVSRRVFE